MPNRKSKVKRSRRLGVPLTAKAARLMEKRAQRGAPGGRSTRRRRQQTDYGRQLMEKQRLREQYGLEERQLLLLFREAQKAVGNTEERLLQLLESRLDNIVYKAGFAPSLLAARQLVTHGHIVVNGKKASRPGARLRPQDVVTLRPKSSSLQAVKESLSQSSMPSYIERVPGGTGAVYMRVPLAGEIPVHSDLSAVVGFYSR